MEDNSIKLLNECSSGCEMAVKSIAQVTEYAQGEKLVRILKSYDKKHKELDEEVALLLARYGEEEKEPAMMAEMGSWMKIEMKMMMHPSDGQIAKLMMDGCNMGIKSISEYLNKYQDASKESCAAAKKLIKIEEDFMKEMKEFV